MKRGKITILSVILITFLLIGTVTAQENGQEKVNFFQTMMKYTLGWLFETSPDTGYGRCIINLDCEGSFPLPISDRVCVGNRIFQSYSEIICRENKCESIVYSKPIETCKDKTPFCKDGKCTEKPSIKDLVDDCKDEKERTYCKCNHGTKNPTPTPLPKFYFTYETYPKDLFADWIEITGDNVYSYLEWEESIDIPKYLNSLHHNDYRGTNYKPLIELMELEEYQRFVELWGINDPPKGPMFGFLSPEDTQSPHFDIYSFEQKIKTDPEFFQREGLFEGKWKLIYKQKINLLRQHNRISDEQYNEITLAMCRCDKYGQCVDETRGRPLNAMKSNCEDCGKGTFNGCDSAECRKLGLDCVWTNGFWYNTCESRFKNIDVTKYYEEYGKTTIYNTENAGPSPSEGPYPVSID